MYNLIRYSSNCSKTTGNLYFILKMKQQILILILLIIIISNLLENNNNKLLGNTEVDGVDGILKNETIAVPLK